MVATKERRLTPKQERFVAAYIETGNASEAYRQAYNASKMKPETVNDTAWKSLRKPLIAQRLKELQAQAALKCVVTVESLTAELESARLLAERNDQPSAVVAAVMGKAKLHGLLVEKVEARTQQFVVVAPPVIENTDAWLANVKLNNAQREAKILLYETRPLN